MPSKRLLNLPTHSPPSDVVIRQAENLDENRIMLYRKGKYLGNGYFLVEISTSKELVLFTIDIFILLLLMWKVKRVI